MADEQTEIGEGWFVYILRLLFRLVFCGGLAFVLFQMVRKVEKDKMIELCRQIVKMANVVIVAFIKQARKHIKQQYKLDFLGEANVSEEKKSSNFLSPIIRHPYYRICSSLLLEAYIGIFRILINALNQLLLYCGYLKRELIQLINPVDKNMQLHLICPLSATKFVEPVLLNQCGHTFQKSNIENYIGKYSKCPVCETPAKRINIKKNYIVENILKALEQEKPSQPTRKHKNSSSSNTWSFLFLIFIVMIVFYFQPKPQPPVVTVKDMLTKTYNIVNKDLMSINQYNQHKAQFINLFNSPEGSNQLTISRNKKLITSKVRVQIVKQNHFLTELRILGEAEKGIWSGEGYLMPRNEGLYFWMVVTEMNKQQNSDLIYESYILQVPLNQISGKWYYLGHVTDRRFSGEWQVSTPLTEAEVASSHVPATPIVVEEAKKQSLPETQKQNLEL